jgi:hypothetical protein
MLDDAVGPAELSVSIAMGIASINLAILVVAPTLVVNAKKNFYRYFRKKNAIHNVIRILSVATPISLVSVAVALLGRVLGCTFLLRTSPPLTLVSLALNFSAVVVLVINISRENDEELQTH